MKAVLLSVKPKWCKLIFSGEKTIEVRKTAPKLETPFKVYVYQTKHKGKSIVSEALSTVYGGGKVIGSFVCYKIEKIEFQAQCSSTLSERWTFNRIAKQACLTAVDMGAYLNGDNGYGWHITDLKIYDKPKELGEFYTICNKYGDDSCGDCPYLAVEQCSFPCDDCVDTWCSVDNIKPITRPPQSWCYVEDK